MPAAQDRHHDAVARAQPDLAGQGGGHARPALGRAVLAHLRPGPGHRGRAQRHRSLDARPAPPTWRTGCPCCAGCGPARWSATTARPGRSRRSRSRPGPVQDPFDVWLGGNVPAALERCGRLGDGWLPAFCTPEDAEAGKVEIDRVAAEHGRTISPEHFGVSLAYAPEGTDVGALASSPLARRARGRPLEDIIPVGLQGPADDDRAVPRRRLLEVRGATHGGARRRLAGRARTAGRCGGSAPDLSG